MGSSTGWWMLLGATLVAAAGLTMPTASRAASSDSSAWSRELDMARNAMEAGAWLEAEDHLRAVLHAHPDQANAAEMLRGLYERSLVDLPINESEVATTHGLLGDDFTRMTTRHFVILSDCDQQWTRSRAQLLERAYHQYFRMMRRMRLEATPPEHKLLCVLIHDHDRYRAFARAHDGIDAPWVAGYYASLSNRVVFYNDETGPAFQRADEQLAEYAQSIDELESEAHEAEEFGDGRRAARTHERVRELREHLGEERARVRNEAVVASTAKTLHEAVHLIAFNCGLQTRTHEFPFWLTEGLATAFETSEPDRSFGPDDTFDLRESEFSEILGSDDRMVPVGLLIQRTHVPGGEGIEAEVMYAQAYALFRYLYRFEREQLAGLFRDIASEPAGRIPPRRQLELFEARLGDPDRLERRWLRWEQMQAPTQVVRVGG